MTYMELVQIIYDILIFGGALLMIVIAVSYLLSKSKQGSIKNSVNRTPNIIIQKSNPMVFNQQQVLYKDEAFIPSANIYKIGSGANKDLKIIRKPTFTDNESPQNNLVSRPTGHPTNGNGRRYTIVNEEMKKTLKPTVINF